MNLLALRSATGAAAVAVVVCATLVCVANTSEEKALSERVRRHRVVFTTVPTRIQNSPILAVSSLGVGDDAVRLYRCASHLQADEIATIRGPGRFGSAILSVPALDGAMVIGAPGHNVSSGGVYLAAAPEWNAQLICKSPFPEDSEFGSALCAIVRDGHDDGLLVAVGCPQRPGVTGSRGSIHIVSVERQVVVRGLQAPDGSPSFGSSLLGVPDQDNDGYSDVLVGSTGGGGALWLVSGLDGSTILRLSCESPSDVVTSAISFVAPSKMGPSRVAAVVLNCEGATVPVTKMQFWSLADGRTVGPDRVSAAAAWRCAIRDCSSDDASMVTIKDVNGDGVQDLAVGLPTASHGLAGYLGGVVILSGLDGTVLRELTWPGTERAFGATLAWMPTSRDGVLVIGAQDILLGQHAVYMIDGGFHAPSARRVLPY